MSTPIVDLNKLSYRYGDRVAVDELTMAVDPGEIFGFLGPNGSGKSTLFRILSTLIPPPPDTVRLFGLDAAVDAIRIRPRLGVVFQSPSLDKQLTAEENLRHHGHLYGLSGSNLEDQITLQLRRMNLLDRRGERVEGFSGGMRRRVELAKGLLNQPRILLLDEPSTGLDPAARLELWAALEQVRAAGVTVLLTTHLMDEADRCSKLALLKQGKLVATGTPAELKLGIGGDVVTLTSDEPGALAETLWTESGFAATQVEGVLRIETADGYASVPKIVAAARGRLRSISVGKPTLEDVFLQMTGERFEVPITVEDGGMKTKRRLRR